MNHNLSIVRTTVILCRRCHSVNLGFMLFLLLLFFINLHNALSLTWQPLATRGFVDMFGCSFTDRNIASTLLNSLPIK